MICRATLEIVSEFTSYNCSLFTSQQQQQQQQQQRWESTPSLDATQKDTLARDITIREFQKALKQQLALNTESAPGKDGISYRFIDKALSITGPLLVEDFNNLFSATELSETMKPVLFRFILKEGKDIDDVTSYRPIALMSSITRLFPKVMVNRLQPIFQNIISEDQQGFIHGRSSHFNIQRLQQLVDKMNQHPDKFQNSFILQLDFQKAFDRVSHQFLKQQLQLISIPDKAINAIMLIVTQQQGQALVNNFLGMPFPITQGLRQGDPMSPLLFALMILTADDVIATVNDETDAAIFHSLISQFEKLFNLKLNPMKSVAYGTPGAKNRVIENWKIPMNSITDLKFVYLGIPLSRLD
ncbi:unnamed protein product [Ambrosiozyma monospora]|uniref:Unnamed protein product n=1 Tax=Ambrosiozyma monospora TaxID=43982 RepID=A0ACB5SS95_AMBMO|nr:unnamed protein product [Ambrosiozyma monospora]